MGVFVLTNYPKTNERNTNFESVVADSTDLQEKVKAGADLVALAKKPALNSPKKNWRAAGKSFKNPTKA